MNENKTKLFPYLSPLGAFSLALGTSVGWGSLVVTTNTYLAKAGPLGSILGLLLATVIMLVIAKNYNYMMRCFPDAGGAYSYAKEVFGYDHGFLMAWFLFLSYMAVYWANATSLPLFARYFIGDIFQFGPHYSVLGYKLYLGEALLSAFAMLAICGICILHNKLTARLMIALVCIFSAGITICFIVTMSKNSASAGSLQPLFIPDKNAFSQIIRITCISPWAFIGFENISNSTEEFTFKRDKIFKVLVASVIASTIMYVFILLISITAYPPEYSSWLEYINDLDNLSGIKALPPFYAARHHFGNTGLFVLMASLFALILTSMIGNVVAVSRLLYSVAKDNIIPERFAQVNKNNVPHKAIILLTAVSLVMPFLGRTAISWIIDVTTLGATLIYGFVSASALKMASSRGDKTEKTTGIIGLVLMIFFGIFLLLPNLMSQGTMAKESYILFTVWAVLGFLFFRHILKKDKTKRFGNSIIVWIALLSLILFTAIIWMDESATNATMKAINEVSEHYSRYSTEYDKEFMDGVISEFNRTTIINMTVVVGLFGIALSMLLNNYKLMSSRAQESEELLGNMRDTAYRDPLTGVKSKHAFAEYESKLNDQIRGGYIDAFSVIVCDVNGLKHINDTLGHKAGDAYICAGCNIICTTFSHSPVFRVGGDEFVVVTTGDDYENRAALLERFNKKVEENIALNKAVVSAGISDYIPGEDAELHPVFERADALMYERKKQLKAMGAKTRD